jgi:hypothetical protein
MRKQGRRLTGMSVLCDGGAISFGQPRVTLRFWYVGSRTKMTFGRSSVRSRELGRRLLLAQRNAGFNGLQLGMKMEWSPSMLSRTMSGQRSTSEAEAATILALCGVVGDERDAVLRFCRPYEDSFLRLPADEQWSVYLAHACEAARLCEFQPLIVPSLLQTPEYTRALVGDGLLASAQEEQITARRSAMALLRVPEIEVFVHELSLRTPVGDDMAMMSDQLHHLLALSVRPEVSLRVVPLRRCIYAGQYGGFTLLEFADHEPVLCLVDHISAVLLDDGPAVDFYRSIVNELNGVALGEENSRRLITKISVDMYGGQTDDDFIRSAMEG